MDFSVSERVRSFRGLVREFLKSEVARWAKVVQDANIKAD